MEHRGSWLGAAPLEPVAAEAPLLLAGVLGLDRHLKDMQLDVSIAGPLDVHLPAEDGRRPPVAILPRLLPDIEDLLARHVGPGPRAPTSLMTEASLEKMPTTRARPLTPDLGVTLRGAAPSCSAGCERRPGRSR
jgi:hypothetical protein